MAGDAVLTLTWNVADVTPLFETTTFTVVNRAISYGAIALIWLRDTSISGDATPLKVTDVVPSVVATIPLAVSCRPMGVEGPIFKPKMVKISPGETGPVNKLALFTTALIAGVAGGVRISVTMIGCVGPAGLEDRLTMSVYVPGASVDTTV